MLKSVEVFTEERDFDIVGTKKEQVTLETKKKDLSRNKKGK